MPTYKSNVVGDPIFYHSGGKLDESDPNSPVEGKGWYFCDETWSEYHGPYQSYGECEGAIEYYVKECL